MKTLKDYLTECKKDYRFIVKIAGELPEEFEGTLKSRLQQYNPTTFEKVATTPIQKQPIDFPNKQNCEVHIFHIVCDYPVIPPEIAAKIAQMKVPASNVLVHNEGDPTLSYIPLADQELSGEALLTDPTYKEAESHKSSDFFGAEYNKGFLKELAKQAKERKTELGQNVEYKIVKQKANKSGTSSAIGSK